MQAFSQKNSSFFGECILTFSGVHSKTISNALQKMFHGLEQTILTISNALQKMFHGLEQTILGTYWEISGLFHSRRRDL